MKTSEVASVRVAVAIATLLLLTGAAARAGEGESGNSSKSSKEKEKVPAEKVWTNEDIEALQGGVSFLGGGSVIEQTPAPTEAQPESWWRRRAEMYAERLSELDSRLQEYQKKETLAVNPYTRALAGTVKDEEGREHLLTPAEIQAEIQRLKDARAAELQGIGTLRQAADNLGVPESWLDNLPKDEAAPGPKEPPLFVEPRHGTGEGQGQPPIFIEPGKKPAPKRSAEGGQQP